MAAIYPILSTRVSDALIQARLVSQFGFDQQELVRLQDQVSTGYRISTPSQDAPAAVRAITLQRLLEQKQQARVNLSATQSFIAATDAALTGASDLLNGIHALSLRAMSTSSTDEQRAALREEVDAAIQQFLDVGNRQFRGRYLFAGSRSETQPFTQTDRHVVYHGNETTLPTYADIGFLSDTNVTGAEAFGAMSAAVRGTADLNPILTRETRLDALRGGRGITRGSLVISDGTNSQVVDISSAETVGDVIDLIEAKPPAGREVNVTLSAQGLVVDLDDAGGGNLTIGEVTGGSTAAELGIRETNGTGTAPLHGEDLNPRLQLTTRLADLLGARASARLVSAGENNDIYIEATQNGAAFNNVQVQFVHATAVGNQAIATYDSVGGVLTIDISPGVTQASTVVDAINATGAFTAQLDDKLDDNNDGVGVVEFAATATTSGGAGEDFDRTAGLQIVNGGQTHTLDVSEAETVEDLLNVLNGSDAQVAASINAAGTGLDVRSRVSGADFMIGENGGQTATQLGLRTFTRDTYLPELNHGAGVEDHPGIDFIIQRRDGVTLDIDIATAVTIGDVIDRINSHAANVGNAVVARLAQFGNGIELEDANAAGIQDLTVIRANGFSAWHLGLVPLNQDQSVAAAPAPGDPQVLTGRDVNPQEAEGVFNSLLRLRDALEDFNLPLLERAAGLIEANQSQLVFFRAGLGSQARSLETLEERIDREDIELKSALSTEIDTDMVQAISDLAARQASLEATLRLVGQVSRLSVLDFL